MKSYFLLQFNLINRHFTDFDLHPLLGYGFVILLFILGSSCVFLFGNYSPYAYTFIGFGVATTLGGERRNDFLRNCFSKSDYTRIRIIENILVTLPFGCFLLYKSEHLLAAMLPLIAISMAFIDFKTKSNLTIPTPFSKKPFEFTVGFRKTFISFIFAYFLAFKGVESSNFKISFLSYLLIGITCITYYNKPENKLLIWIYNFSATQFLWHKILTALWYVTILCLPVLVLTAVFYPAEIINQLVAILLIYVALTTTILVKYSSLGQIDHSITKLIMISVFLPPLLIVVLPMLYSSSIRNIKLILQC